MAESRPLFGRWAGLGFAAAAGGRGESARCGSPAPRVRERRLEVRRSSFTECCEGGEGATEKRSRGGASVQSESQCLSHAPSSVRGARGRASAPCLLSPRPPAAAAANPRPPTELAPPGGLGSAKNLEIKTLDLDLDPGRGGGMASSNPWPRKAAGLAGIAVGLLGCAAGGLRTRGVAPRPPPQHPPPDEDDDLEVLEGFGQWPSTRHRPKEGPRGATRVSDKGHEAHAPSEGRTWTDADPPPNTQRPTRPARRFALKVVWGASRPPRP